MILWSNLGKKTWRHAQHCDFIYKWSIKPSGVLLIEQILQFEVCQQNIIVWMNKICHPWNSDALYLFIKGLFYNSALYMTHYSLPGLPLCIVSSWSFVSALNSWTPNCRKSPILTLPKVSRLEAKTKNSTKRFGIIIIILLFIHLTLFIYLLKRTFLYEIWLKFLYFYFRINKNH